MPSRKWAVAGCALLVAGCSSLLPHGEQTMPARWASFDAAKAAFDAVEPYRSNTAALRDLGFDAGTNPNVQILNYLEVLERILPNKLLSREDLAAGLQDCIAAGEACRAFEINHREVKNRRYGNFLADFLSFRRKTETTGWEFNAVFVLRDDLVVYKVWSGKPQILEHSETSNPLGPLQGIGSSLVRP